MVCYGGGGGDFNFLPLITPKLPSLQSTELEATLKESDRVRKVIIELN